MDAVRKPGKKINEINPGSALSLGCPAQGGTTGRSKPVGKSLQPVCRLAIQAVNAAPRRFAYRPNRAGAWHQPELAHMRRDRLRGQLRAPAPRPPALHPTV